MKTLYCLGLLAALAAFPAAAQDSAACPRLPAGSGLQWEQKGNSGFTVCRAAINGSQVLGLMFTSEPTVKPSRRNRREEGRIGAHEVYWHQPEIADGSGAYKRVAVVELGKKRYMQAWIDADNDQALQRLIGVAQGIALN